MECVCRKEGVTANRKSELWTQSKSKKRPLRATGFNPVVTKGTHPREHGTKPRLQPLAFSRLLGLWFNSL